MTKKEFIDAVAEKADISKKDAETFINAYASVVEDAVGHFKAKDTTVLLHGIGTLKVTRKEAYVSRNPKTGEPCEVDESRRITFKATKSLKDFANEKPAKKTAEKTTKKVSADKKKTAGKVVVKGKKKK